MYRTVLCYHPYLVSILFDDLLSLHLVTFLMFFIIVIIMTNTTITVGTAINSTKSSGNEALLAR